MCEGLRASTYPEGSLHTMLRESESRGRAKLADTRTCPVGGNGSTEAEVIRRAPTCLCRFRGSGFGYKVSCCVYASFPLLELCTRGLYSRGSCGVLSGVFYGRLRIINECASASRDGFLCPSHRFACTRGVSRSALDVMGLLCKTPFCCPLVAVIVYARCPLA